jgi:DNA-binding Lrp family transcriptional regulator
MEHKLNPEAKRLLFRLLQKEFPLSKRPFLAIAKRVGLKEVELISLLKDWEREGRLRQISAIFNPEYFGHRSSLFALKVSEKKLSLAIDRINSHPGVSHNYLRNHEYNLWFTLVVPEGKDLLEEAKALCQEFTENGLLFLPILKNIKSRWYLKLSKKGERISKAEELLILPKMMLGW